VWVGGGSRETDFQKKWDRTPLGQIVWKSEEDAAKASLQKLPMPCCIPLRICANAFRTQNRVDGLKGNECELKCPLGLDSRNLIFWYPQTPSTASYLAVCLSLRARLPHPQDEHFHQWLGPIGWQVIEPTYINATCSSTRQHVLMHTLMPLP
jgi:hypothetical protein